MSHCPHVALTVVLLACSSAPEVTLCVRTAPNDPVFSASATDVVLRALPAEGLEVSRTFRADAEEFALPEIAFGRWLFEVEVRQGQTVIASGRSALTEISRSTKELACIYVATHGSFGELSAGFALGATGPVFASSGADETFVLVGSTLVNYEQSSGLWGTASVEIPSAPVPSLWVALPGGRGVRISETHALILANGRLKELALAESPGPLFGVSAAALGPDRVLLMGGAFSLEGAPESEAGLRIVDLLNGVVDVLPGTWPLRESAVASLPNGQVLVLGGLEADATDLRASREIGLVDSSAGLVARSRLDDPRLHSGALYHDGNVLVFGGRSTGGTALGTIERLRLGGGEIVHVGRPSPMRAARASPAVIPAGDDILILGGIVDPSSGDPEAERFRYALDGTEGLEEPTLRLRAPTSAPLFDGTFLVVAEEGGFVVQP